MLREEEECGFLKKRTKELLSFSSNSGFPRAAPLAGQWIEVFCFFFKKRSFPSPPNQPDPRQGRFGRDGGWIP
jgi:hypothetical protein